MPVYRCVCGLSHHQTRLRACKHTHTFNKLRSLYTYGARTSESRGWREKEGGWKRWNQCLCLPCWGWTEFWLSGCVYMKRKGKGGILARPSTSPQMLFHPLSLYLYVCVCPHVRMCLVRLPRTIIISKGGFCLFLPFFVQTKLNYNQIGYPTDRKQTIVFFFFFATRFIWMSLCFYLILSVFFIIYSFFSEARMATSVILVNWDFCGWKFLC